MYNISSRLDNKWGKSFEEYLIFLSEMNINNIEINDKIDTIDLIDMDGGLIEKYRNLLIYYNKKIVLINSTIDLSSIENYQLLFRKAALLKAECIRINLDSHAMNPIQLKEIEAVLKIGKSYNIRCTIENDAPVFNDLLQLQFFNLFKEYNPGLILNPLEIVRQKKHPFLNIFYNCKFKNNIYFLRINDGLFIDGTPIMAGNGNAEIKELISAMTARNYKGYLSVESYLEPYDIENIRLTLNRLKAILVTI